MAKRTTSRKFKTPRWFKYQIRRTPYRGKLDTRLIAKIVAQLYGSSLDECLRRAQWLDVTFRHNSRRISWCSFALRNPEVAAAYYARLYTTEVENGDHPVAA